MANVKSITPNTPADFTPTLGNYKDLRQFRFWCQKVLPLVYDDSLSYYELLCKVVNILNGTIENVNLAGEDMEKMYNAYTELEGYCNTYFDNLDVDKEINEKLDLMAVDGTLNRLVSRNVQIAPVFVDSVNAMTDVTRVYVLKTDGHLYHHNGVSFVDSGIAYGINGVYPNNVDFDTWTDAPQQFQPFASYRYNPNADTTESYGDYPNGSLVGKVTATEASATSSHAVFMLKTPLAIDKYPANKCLYVYVFSTSDEEFKARIYASSALDWNPVNTILNKYAVIRKGLNIINLDNMVAGTGGHTTIKSIGVGALSKPEYFNSISVSLLCGDVFNIKTSTITPSNIVNEGWVNAPQQLQPFIRRRYYYNTSTLESYVDYESATFIGKCTAETANDNSHCVFRLKNPIVINQHPESNGLYAFVLNENEEELTTFIYASADTDWNPMNTVYGADKYVLKRGLNVVRLPLYRTGTTKTETIIDFGISIYNAKAEQYNNLTISLMRGYMVTPDDMAKTLTGNYNYDMICWGDSITAGAGGSGATYPSVCANELGVSVLNAGVGGETPATISARQGGNSIMLPKGTVNTYSIFKDALGNTVAPLRQGSGGYSATYCYVNGVKCTLALSQTNSTSTDAVWTITGYEDELLCETPIMLNGGTFNSKITTIFIGQNGNSLEDRMTYIDAMIARTNGKVVVLGLSTGTSETRAVEEKTLLSKYGNRFFNTRHMLSQYGLSVAGVTPTGADNASIAEGSVPPSLLYDSVHLNGKGYEALGKMLADKIRSLGYLSD